MQTTKEENNPDAVIVPKQSSVDTPILFNIYLDILLNRLQNDGYGCHIGKQYMGFFADADDIVLLSPTVLSLRCNNSTVRKPAAEDAWTN